MMVKKRPEDKSLFFDVCVALSSVGIIAIIFRLLWLPDLQSKMVTGGAAPDYILEMCRSLVLYVYIPFVLWCFVLGEMTHNLSQVDKIWSVFPPVCLWFVTYYEASQHQMTWNYKLVLMSCLATVWGIRLSYQFYMKGGYSIRFWSGEEDYRWETVRRQLPLLRNRFVFLVFDLGFICVYQLLLLATISGVVAVATIMVDHSAGLARDSLALKDVIVGLMVLVLILVEWLSDYQQQVFQKEKHQRIRTKMSLHCPQNHYELGFNTNGLFAYSRHPNFTAEQLIWLAFFCFSVNHFSLTDPATWCQLGGPLNLAISGWVLLVVIFAKSTDLTEDISSAKYPMYEKYQKHVHRFVDVKKVLRRVFLGQHCGGNVDFLK